MKELHTYMSKNLIKILANSAKFTLTLLFPRGVDVNKRTVTTHSYNML